MMQLTEEQRKALIDEAEHMLTRYDKRSMNYKVIQISLAALTAERCGSLIQAVNPQTGSVTISYRARGIASIDPTEVSEWEMQEIEHLYTAPPVAALRLPDEADGSNLPFAAMGWNACLAEVKRLNAAAPQPVKLKPIIQISYTQDEITCMCNVRNDDIEAIRAAGYQVEE